MSMANAKGERHAPRSSPERKNPRNSIRKRLRSPAAEINELKIFKEIVSARALEIVAKWVAFFIIHKPIKPETITQRLKWSRR